MTSDFQTELYSLAIIRSMIRVRMTKRTTDITRTMPGSELVVCVREIFVPL